jgi:hypothetical protein
MKIGPNIRENDLVFYYDVGNTKSYVGEPTDNLIPNPTINALPTFGNGWGSYNTNQYCGNNGCNVYWDLPTISSISNNIVTTSSAHTLRTYDVINPQTSGGGVGAGQQYFVKVISSTQFTLHQYNSSQDGSQGYINPDTGNHKVYDSIALDQRIPINPSGFPTKWFGNPHQPNSGLVKEIIPNGYKVDFNSYTDCIRLHIPRPTGVDGMSYGVDTSVVIGQTYTTSFWVKAVSPSSVGRNISFQHYNYGGVAGANGFYGSINLGAIGEWIRFTMTFVPTHNTLISYWFPQGDYVYSFDLANIQIEQKTHVTPFIAGSRNSNEILKNLMDSSVKVGFPNMSYGNDNTMSFDGVDDYLTLPINNYDFTNGITAEFVANFTNVGSWQRLFDFGNGPNSDNILFSRYGSSDDLAFHVYKGAVSTVLYCTNCIVNNKLSHYAVTLNGATAVMYVNGIAKTSSSFLTLPNNVSRTNNYIGRSNWNDTYFQGQIPMVKIYNKGLSGLEINNNYNSIKHRFNI